MDWIVFGLGKSIHQLTREEAKEYNTLGVNDIFATHDVDHLVIPDRWDRFTEPRLQTIAKSTPKTLWLKETRSFPGLEEHPDVRHYKVAKWNGFWSLDLPEDTVPYCYISPFIASAIAWKYLNAERIGIIGVDLLTDHHQHKNAHILNPCFKILREKLLERGTELVNLSAESKLTALPFKPLSFIGKK